MPAYSSIVTYGSAVTRTMAPGTANNITTSIYATDLMERTIYAPTSSLGNSNIVIENPLAKAFAPTFLLGVSLPANAAAVTTFAWDVETYFDLTFRGVRFTGASL